ncbi:MAG: CpsD/CapB family tyrosine-protein kinase [Clostridia bacterium]|nr:CpsD/CapB family tyrosine-protein kinase [Clostridia bacterium]
MKISLLDKVFNRSEKRAKKAEQRSNKRSRRIEYLLNEETPFEVTEAFRNLKATLSVSVPKKEGGVVIMTTSAYPEDGKTTVTVNLAMMFALSDAKVLLIDADIRKGRVAKYFKEKSAHGLSDALSGQDTSEAVVRKTAQNDNLYYVACGSPSPRSYELLESEEMKKFIQEQRAKFDYIIIDTPPVLLCSDALALTPLTDGAVLVCRHQLSYLSDMSRALDTLSFAKANVLGVVVNDYKNATSGGYYNGYKKYYRYSSYSYQRKSAETEPKEAEEPSKIETEAKAEAAVTDEL